MSLRHPNLSITNSQIKICSTASALEMADYIKYDFSTIKKAEEKMCQKRTPSTEYTLRLSTNKYVKNIRSQTKHSRSSFIYIVMSICRISC